MRRPRRLFVLVCAASAALVAQSPTSRGIAPVLELEKPVYLADESIRFWVGVDADSPIPEQARASCVLHWVRPGGTAFDEQVPWPRDGDPTRGWRGGWGFGTVTPAIGRYTVSFECAGRHTAAQSFQVAADPFAGRLSAHWAFAAGKSGGPDSHRALLRVENRTGRPVRFAEPGLIGSEVWLEIRTTGSPSIATVPAPASALLDPAEIPAFSLDRLDWNNQSQWPMIAVSDGASADRPLALGSAYAYRQGQEYEVTIHTVLTVFIGERRDPDAALFPLRIPVSAAARFRW